MRRFVTFARVGKTLKMATKNPAPQKTDEIPETVCHRAMTAPPESYYLAEYRGRTIYFCTEFCLEAFNADPERFYNAHSRRKDALR